MVEENFNTALKHLEEAVRISEEINDTVSLVLSSYWLGVVLSWNCDFQKAIYHIGKALDITLAANNLWGITTMKSTLSLLSYYYYGKINQAYQNSHEVLQVAEKSADIFSNSFAYTSHGISCLGKGFLEDAEKHLIKGVEFCERITFFLLNAIANGALGETFFEVGEYKKAKEPYIRAISLLEHNRLFPSWINFNKICLARAKVLNNEKDIDLELLYKYVIGNKLKVYTGIMQRYIADILLNTDDKNICEAEDFLIKAIKADTQNEMIWHLGRDYALYAELFQRKGDKSKARENLNKAVEILRECGADGWVEKYEKELAAIS